MKRLSHLRSTRLPLRASAALLALLLALPAALTACQPAPDHPDATPTEGETPAQSEPMTLPGVETSAGTEPGTETKPPEVFVPADTMIGDGVEGQVYPAFSKVGGLYTDTALEVTITAPEGYTVRYTTDGATPTKRSKEYTAPLTFSHKKGEATVVRAACFDADGTLTGQVITHTYVTVDKTAGAVYTVMLTTDEGNLDAMYADVRAKVERAAHAEIIAPDGTRVVSQDVGLRLFGGSSRALAQKSFKIIARKDGYFEGVPYTGAGTFTYPFFPERTVLAGKNAGKVLTKFDGLILRNGGNDSLLSTAADPMDTTLLRDGLANEFVHRYSTHVGASLSHFAAVYLNGEYYGLLELRENQNEDYVKRLWGVADDDVVVVKSELDTTIACKDHAGSGGGGCRFCGSWFFYETDEDAAAQAEMQAWIALCKKAAGAVNADEATYRKVLEEVSAKVDLENVKEYVALATFLCNSDWPHNNIRVWRYTGAPVEGVDITDGKWRFATRDMDMTMSRYSSPNVLPDLENRPEADMFAWVFSNYVEGYEDTQRYEDGLYLQGLFSFLMRDDSFRASFAEYARTLASSEAKATLQALYDEMFAQVKPSIGDHIARWSGQIAGGYKASSWATASRRIEKFIKDRPAHYLAQLENLLSMYD